MQIEYRRGGQGGSAELRGATESPQLVRAHGRGALVQIEAGATTLWLCMRGVVAIDSADGSARLGARQWLVLPAEGAVRAVARSAAADWLVLALPASMPGKLTRQGLHRAIAEPALFPLRQRCNRALMSAAVALIRTAEHTGLTPSQRQARLGLLLGDLICLAVESQAVEVDPWLARASGRTDRHRRQVLLRLMGARNRILNAPFGRNDIDSLALAARYSKSHFIRIFRDVYGITPHDMLTFARIELAKTLIADGRLAIAEVAANVGFESRYAFSRLFKRHVGLTASDYRRAA